MAAFGKDPRDLTHVTPFGGGTANQREHYRKQCEAESRESRKAGGGGPYWKDTFRLPDHPRMGRFIPGKYVVPYVLEDNTIVEETLEYFPFYVHRHPTSKKTAVCCAGPLRMDKNRREPCLGCDMFWGSGKEDRGKYMSNTPQFGFTWYDYGLWCKLPSDARNPSTGQPYYDWVPVAPNDQRVGQYEYKIGNLIPWPMFAMHKEQLFGYMDQTICTDCVTCGSQASIICTAKMCGNPSCGALVVDLRTTTLNAEQTKKLNAPYGCALCGQVLFVREVLSCRACAQYNLTPQRATLFDEDLELTAIPTGKNNQTALLPTNRSNPRPIQVDAATAANIKPLRLDAKFAPTPLEEQRKLWGIPKGPASQTQVPVAYPTFNPPMQTAMPAAPAPYPVFTPPTFAQQPLMPTPPASMAAPAMPNGGMPIWPASQAQPAFSPPSMNLPGWPPFSGQQGQ